jgi:DNA-binding IclR family transcriptional regulator
LPYKLTKLLEILGDGNWHETNQLCQQMDLSDVEVQRIMDFLGEYDFAEVDEAKSRVRIKKDFKRILTQTA